MATNQQKYKIQALSKKWLCASLASAALLLSACADNDPALNEPEAMENIDDAQTPIEQQAAGVNDVNSVSTNDTADTLGRDDIVVASDVEGNEMGSTRGEISSLDGTATTDDAVTADDSTAIGAGDSDVLDGTEQEEHISTY